MTPGARSRGWAAGGQRGGGSTRGGDSGAQAGGGGAGILGSGPNRCSGMLARSQEPRAGSRGGDRRVRLRRGRGRQGGPRRDLPVPGAASLGRLESLLSFSPPGRAPPPGAKLVVFLLFLLLLHLLRLLLLL